MSGAWSNDQLNSLFIYNPLTGDLLLSIDATGIYFTAPIAGAGLKIAATPDTGGYAIIGINLAGGGEILLHPPNSAVAGVTYSSSGFVVASELVNSPTNVQGYTTISSPVITGKSQCFLALVGGSNTSPPEDSYAAWSAMSQMVGPNNNQMGFGCVYRTNTTSSFNFTATTDTITDVLVETNGVMSAARVYEAEFMGQVKSGTAGDQVGFRLYAANSATSLTGAVLLRDWGVVKIDTATVGQPVYLRELFAGVPGKFLILACRRTSGAGTCNWAGGSRSINDFSI
jgi:hypothetical protein